MRGYRLRTALRGGLVAVLLQAPLAGAAVPSHWPDALMHDGYEGVAAGPFNDADAARFLAQATFGPTDADIAHLRALAASNGGFGYDAWLTEQFGFTASSQGDYVAWVDGLGENTGDDTLREAWFLGALGGPDPANAALIHKDQLRQRVAFALSEIFVVSEQNTFLSQHPTGLASYYDILANDAFATYDKLLLDVTLSPEMGVYLNMLGNPRANLLQNLHPDENYAREINQLFSIGLVMLNDDGTPQTSNGSPIPTYNQAVITNFAHVLTGWNWSSCASANFRDCGPSYQTEIDWQTPMTPFAAWHDNGLDATNDFACKQLLSYAAAANSPQIPPYQNCATGGVHGMLSPGGTPQSDLAFALANIFNHPNVAPFIGRQLIQRLVTSNPSPAYVARVAGVFKDDGSPQHARGNLRAVVRAILLDPEARWGQWHMPDSFGKLREPLLALTHYWRAMNALHHCGIDYTSGYTHHYANQPYRYAGYGTVYSTDDTVYGSGVGQGPLNADSVFNFFKPGFIPAGEMATRGLFGPEFQISTDTIITNTTNSTASKANGYDLTDACDTGDPYDNGNVAINRTQDMALAGSANGGAADPADTLVDAYNVRFMSGQMSPFMRAQLLSALNPIGAAHYNFYSYPNWQFERISKALLLILTSPEYMIQK